MNNESTSDTISTLSAGLQLFSGEEMTDKKAAYLSYRISNFSSRESEKLANVSRKQVMRWRESDPQFRHLEGEGLPGLRDSMSNKLLDMQFTRNFRLVMEKDFRVMYKDATGEPMTASELRYMEKIRQHYTPQSLAAVRQILNGGTIEQPFDFTKLVMEIKREQITIVQENRG